MKTTGLLLMLLFCFIAQAIELTTDNPETLITTRAADYSVFGLSLGMTQREALKVIKKNGSIVAERDKYNDNTLYIYRVDENGKKTKDTLLSLAWKKDKPKMYSIAAFSKVKPLLSEKFQFLLSKEALDNNSKTKQSFLGTEDSAGITFELESLKWKHIAHKYNNIGLSVIDKQTNQVTKSVIFSFYTE